MHANFKYFIGEKWYSVENFTTLSDDDLIEILSWRNEDSVRINMVSADIIPVENHFRFVRSLVNNEQKCYFRVSGEDSGRIGVIYLDKIKDNEAWLGIYANPFSEIAGKGVALMQILFKLAFDELKIRTLFLEVKQDNKRAIGLYHKMSFETLKSENGFVIMKKNNNEE